jgi:hypothetical protein
MFAKRGESIGFVAQLYSCPVPRVSWSAANTRRSYTYIWNSRVIGWNEPRATRVSLVAKRDE